MKKKFSVNGHAIIKGKEAIGFDSNNLFTAWDNGGIINGLLL